MTQDEQKRAAAQAAIQYVPADCVIGVGTGTTANYFIYELNHTFIVSMRRNNIHD